MRALTYDEKKLLEEALYYAIAESDEDMGELYRAMLKLVENDQLGLR